MQEPIGVIVHAGQPRLLHWRGRLYPVRHVLDFWRAAGHWWMHAPPRDYWLLDAAPLTAEVYRTGTGGGRWMLSRLGD